MCGIIGYVGGEQAKQILLEGLRALEYRGYDSAGIAVLDDGSASLSIERAPGKLRELESKLATALMPGRIGIGHTRWATHGRPSESNAHPHRADNVVVVHNGIVENFRELKAELVHKGRAFRSETDTEVLAHLVADAMAERGLSFADAFPVALAQVRGGYAAVFMCADDPDIIIAARSAPPLVIGLCDGAALVASDIPALLPHTRRILALEQGEMAILSRHGAEVHKITGGAVKRQSRIVDWTPAQTSMGGHPHFMLKEIHEQPEAIAATLADCLTGRSSAAIKDLGSVKHVIAVAMGTSNHAALILRDYVERLAKVRCTVELASEFRYRDPIVDPATLLIAISQSGETADTLAAAEEGKRRGARVLAITNVEGSSLARMADLQVFTMAGPEIGVASTKAYTTQLCAAYLLALALAKAKGTLSLQEQRKHLAEIDRLPGLVRRVLEDATKARGLGRRLLHSHSSLFLGRGSHIATAMEGALKLKELAYIHAEGCAAGQMKHGPIALVDADFFVLFVAPKDSTYEKNVSTAQEVRARDGRVLAIVTEGDEAMRELSEEVFEIPQCSEELCPIVSILPLQLLAYEAACAKGCDVDRPRNLAKSVTVE